MQAIEIWLTCSTTLPAWNNFYLNVWWFSYYHQKFQQAFPMGKPLKYTYCYEPFQPRGVAKLHQTIFYLNTVIVNHLIRWNIFLLQKKNQQFSF